MYPISTTDIRVASENESDAVLLERRWFAANKAAEAMRMECEILREVMDTAQANWREARTRLASLDALCQALEARYAAYVGHSHAAFMPSPAAPISTEMEPCDVAAA